MIKEDYVSFENAKLLKEKGFDEGCRSYWSDNSSLSFEHTKLFVFNDDDFVYLLRPTLQMAMKWLRVFYQLHITVYSCSQESWAYRITKLHQRLEDGVYAEDFASYEEACDAAIKFCLENYLI